MPLRAVRANTPARPSLPPAAIARTLRHDRRHQAIALLAATLLTLLALGCASRPATDVGGAADSAAVATSTGTATPTAAAVAKATRLTDAQLAAGPVAMVPTPAGLPPDLALTSTSLYGTLQSTPQPPPPATGGAGPGGQMAPVPLMGGGNPNASAVLGSQPHAPALVATAPDAMAGHVEGSLDSNAPSSESYAVIHDNPFADAAAAPLSTFGIDVDTASYSNVRRFLASGQLPPPDAVRIEELINYFPYDDPRPEAGDVPVRVNVSLTEAPWRPEHRLLRVNLTTAPIAFDERPETNLVFLIDVSGSMQDANKLPLVKQSLRLLVEQLGERDRVAIAVYAGSSGLVLPATPGNRQAEILAAIDQLEAGGSTAGSQGIVLAYETAEANLLEGGINRVILATDGDFNVGITDRGELEALIRAQARTGVFLTVLGFGMGNLQDATLETLADRGNGHYAYIDSLAEGRKVFVEELGGTLATVAKDVKLQVEFNPARVAGYRLIGYENRLLAAEDFNDDAKDAGEIGAGHRVTALYEVVPAGAPFPTPVAIAPEDEVDPMRRILDLGRPVRFGAYPGPAGGGAPDVDPLFYADPLAAQAGELATVKVRYKLPDAAISERLAVPVADAPVSLADVGADTRFAAAVAAFGMMLRESPYRGGATWGHVSAWAKYSLGADEAGHRRAFLEIAVRAAELTEAP